MKNWEHCWRTGFLSLWLFPALALWTAFSRPAAAAEPSAGAPARIALVSDLHIQRSTNTEERLYLARLQKTIEAVNAAAVDFVLLAGDLTENGTPTELRDMSERIKQFTAPTWGVAGNHDVGDKVIAGKTNKGAITLRRLVTFEHDCSPSFWLREAAGLRIIGLNSCLYGSPLPQTEKMWEFLERELAKPAAVPTIILQHHPPFLKNVDEPGGDYFNMEPEPRARLLALAKQGGVKAILSGHLHRGLTNRVNDIVLLTTPPVSFGLPKGKQPEGWMLLTFSKGSLSWEFKPLPALTAADLPKEEKK